jgi:tetratricopeptide (TPR) repeat protein
MKSISRAAIAASLMAGVAGFALSAPAAAKDKKEEAKPAALKLSKEVQGPASAAQKALAAKDYATATTSLTAAQAGAKTDDDRYIVAALQLQMEATKIQDARAADQPVNEEGLKAPLDALIANPKTPATDLPKYNYQRGIMAVNAKDTAGALAFFQRAQQLGYNDPNLSLQMVKLKMDAGDVAGGAAELEKAIDAQTAAGQKPSEELYRYAIAKTNQKKMGPQTAGWIKRYVVAYPSPKTWRDGLVTYGMTQSSAVTLDKAQKVDLYRLMRATKALADQYDYENYAQWTYDMGLPYETKAVLTEGKANGKIPASSASANDLLRVANQAIATEGSLAPVEAKAKAGANGRIALNTGDAYLGMGNYAKSIELYRVALEKGGVDADTVNTHLGIALANSGDKAGAKTAFAAVKGAPRADIASLWTIYLDNPPTA